jgi:hypothetical protein
MSNNYTHTDHIHNFAVWAAARAVQRRFPGKTSLIKSLIEIAELKHLIIKEPELSPAQFDDFHRKVAGKMLSYYHENQQNDKMSYGQAAKIIAIYIKTVVIIRNSENSKLAGIAHPPIDRILLTNIGREHPELELGSISWTKLTEFEYFELINKLRTLRFEYFWELEKYWTPTGIEKKSFEPDLRFETETIHQKVSFKETIIKAFRGSKDWIDIPLQNGKMFQARLIADGIEVSNLGASPILDWKVFKEIETLFYEKGKSVLKGDAMSSKLGESMLPIDSVEGWVAYKIYGKQIGDTVFRRISPIVGILIWVGICKKKRGRWLEFI